MYQKSYTPLLFSIPGRIVSPGHTQKTATTKSQMHAFARICKKSKRNIAGQCFFMDLSTHTNTRNNIPKYRFLYTHSHNILFTKPFVIVRWPHKNRTNKQRISSPHDVHTYTHKKEKEEGYQDIQSLLWYYEGQEKRTEKKAWHTANTHKHYDVSTTHTTVSWSYTNGVLILQKIAIHFHSIVQILYTHIHKQTRQRTVPHEACKSLLYDM